MMEWTKDNRVIIKSLGTGSEYGKDLDIKQVKLLGDDRNIAFELNEDGLSIPDLGTKSGDFAHVLEISL